MESRHAALQELLPELDEHLGSQAVLFHQYLKHTWLTCATPVLNQRINLCYQAALEDMNHLGVLIVQLGGVPVADMLELVNYAYLEPEGEGRHSLNTMLESNLHLESVHGSRLCLTLETAEALCETRCMKTVQGLIKSSQKRAVIIKALRQEYQE
jgi:bacterioferritin (cytochrome b1)